MRMPDGDGLAVMRGVREMAPQTAVIFLTAYGTVPEAVHAIQGGACDYLMKPVSFERLREAAARVLAQAQSGLLKGASAKQEQELIGNSPAFRRLLEQARRVARTSADVLIEAESGTGKELVARLIHRESPRRQGPFVAVNCAAFPDQLLESELFGHARGAFTGAMAAKAGKFELANGGTLLLDEVGEMPLDPAAEVAAGAARARSRSARRHAHCAGGCARRCDDRPFAAHERCRWRISRGPCITV